MFLAGEILRKLGELGAGELPHVNGPLLSHLEGTRDLLKTWGNRETLCNAGLYHAVYGTFGFKPALIDVADREAVAALIGTQSEEIVYLFAACDRTHFYKQLSTADAPVYRDRFTGALHRLAPQALRDLSELTLANELEILGAAPDPKRACGRRLRKTLERMTAHASPGATQAYMRLIGPSQWLRLLKYFPAGWAFPSR